MKIISKTRSFFCEMLDELKKTSWPRFGDLKQATIAVFICIVFLGIFISLIDFSLFQTVDLLMRLVG